MFHLRNNMPTDDIAKGEVQALKQADKILAFFVANPDKSYTPFEVLAQLKMTCPITSIRRAMTDLTKAGFLIKDVANQRKGNYGMSNCTWRLTPRPGEQSKLF